MEEFLKFKWFIQYKEKKISAMHLDANQAYNNTHKVIFSIL